MLDQKTQRLSGMQKDRRGEKSKGKHGTLCSSHIPQQKRSGSVIKYFFKYFSGKFEISRMKSYVLKLKGKIKKLPGEGRKKKTSYSRPGIVPSATPQDGKRTTTKHDEERNFL